MPPPQTVKPPTPPPVDESTLVTTTEDAATAPAVEKPAVTMSPSKPAWGKPTAQIWIGQPPEDIRGMFSPSHREKIKDVRTALARGSNFPYAIVYFTTVEDATAAIQALDHPKLKFGDDYDGPPRTGGNYGSRGGGSFSQGSYDARKSVGSDTENRGGFGRGGRGGRGGPMSRGGSTGSFSSRGSGSGSPAPGRGGRGRGGSTVSSHHKESSSDNNDASALWQNDDKPSVPVGAIPSTATTSEISENKPLDASPTPLAPSQPSTSTGGAPASLEGQSSTAGASQSS